jgi:subtilisin family serine protease
LAGLFLIVLIAGEIAFSTPMIRVDAHTLPDQASRLNRRSQRSQLDPLLRKAQDQGRVRVLVQLDLAFKPEGALRSELTRWQQRLAIERAQERLTKRIQAFDGSIVRRFRSVPLVTLEVGQAVLADLADNPAVASVEEDVPVPATLMDSVPLIGGDLARGMGYSGAGQVAAVLDTGVDGEHEFLEGKVISEAEACFSTTSDTYGASSLCPNRLDQQTGPGAAQYCDTGIDGCSHGTHVAGIAARSGASFSGVARDAQIMAVQVFSRFDGTTCTDYGLASPCILTFASDQIAAMEWVYDHRTDYSIAAVNMSLGGGEYSSHCDGDSRKTIIDTLRSVGIATVISSGNSGHRVALGAPACISSAISVGSTTKSDQVSSFSNVASFLTLLSPGSSIYASVPENGYAYFSGTSMAAPHVTGAWAVLKS